MSHLGWKGTQSRNYPLHPLFQLHGDIQTKQTCRLPSPPPHTEYFIHRTYQSTCPDWGCLEQPFLQSHCLPGPQNKPDTQNQPRPKQRF